MPRRTYVVLLLLFAFLLRFGVVLALRDIHHFHGRSAAGADAVEFNAIALNVASGSGYAVTPGHLTSFRAPGFPLLLAGLYAISFENYSLAYICLCLLGAATCFLTYLVAAEVLHEKLSRIAGVLAAVYWPHVYLSTVFLSEILFGFCVALALWCLLRCLRNGSVPLLIAAGVTIGYATLTRPVGILIPFAWVPAILYATRKVTWRGARNAAMIVVAAGLSLAPWIVRNYAVHGRPVLVATNGGSTFYGSNNDIVMHDPHYLGSWISTVSLPGRDAIDAAPDEVSHDQVEWALGKKWIRSHLGDMPLLSLYKVARFWLPDLSSANRKVVIMQVIGYVPFAIAILIGLTAAMLGIRRSLAPAWLAIHAILLVNLVSTLVFYGSARFRDGITPVLIVYAAVGVEVVITRIKRHASARAQSVA